MEGFLKGCLKSTILLISKLLGPFVSMQQPQRIRWFLFASSDRQYSLLIHSVSLHLCEWLYTGRKGRYPVL